MAEIPETPAPAGAETRPPGQPGLRRGTPPVNGALRPRAIDRARKAFHGIGRTRMEIAEWPDDEGRPLEVFFDPLTQADLEALSLDSPKTAYDEHVVLLIRKLRDEHGQPLFDYRDKHSLMHEVEASIVQRIKNAIWSTSSISTIDEATQILGQDRALAFRLMIADRLSQSLETVNGWPLAHLVLWAAYCGQHPMKAGEAPPLG